MTKTKLFAAYLPQYHEIEENNRFWGKGFTDWEGVKNAKPQFKNHNQPRIPEDENYYDLSDWNILKWQSELAKENEISGFNIYHYWFKDSHKVLEKPAENLLNHPEINIEYFFSWDNTSWIRSWSNIAGNSWAPSFDNKDDSQKEEKYLLELDYGREKEWESHFMYLLPFFKDERYLKKNGKPVFAFMRTSDCETLKEMKAYWNQRAIDNGLPGVYLITGTKVFMNKNQLDGQFVYQPRVSAWGKRETIENRLSKYLHLKFNNDGAVKYIYDYDKVWMNILKHAKKNMKNDLILGGVVGFDDTPRRGSGARVIVNESPDKFEKYFSQLYRMCSENDKEILLLTAWNEWGEGAYLEPDTIIHDGYLRAVKNAVKQRK